MAEFSKTGLANVGSGAITDDVFSIHIDAPGAKPLKIKNPEIKGVAAINNMGLCPEPMEILPTFVLEEHTTPCTEIDGKSAPHFCPHIIEHASHHSRRKRKA